MQGGDNPGVKTAVKKKRGGQGFIVLSILLLGVGGAGFGLGFTQKFVPIEIVSPDTAPGAKITTVVPAATTTPATPTTATTPATATTPTATSTPAVIPVNTVTSTASGTSASAPSSLKKAYWIQTSGWDKTGYTITVYINDQPVGNFDSIDRTEEVTKFVKPGENKVRFEAKSHPSEDRNDFTGAFLTVSVNQGQKSSDNDFKDGQPVIEYKRKVTETTDFDDTMDFAAI